MAERSRSENPEVESPEQAVSNAVATLENRDATEPVDPAVARAKEWMRVKGAAKDTAMFFVDTGRVGSSSIYKILRSVLKFTKEAVVKKGKVGFAAGREIGAEAFSFEDKKEKK